MSNIEALEELYNHRFSEVLEPLALQLRERVEELIQDLPRIDKVASRAKSVESFIEKAAEEEDDQPKYSDPIHQIQDQIGVRIVTHYLSDREDVSRKVMDYFNPIEEKHIVPESPKEFDYEAMHFILLVPRDFHLPEFPDEHRPTCFELQIKTLFQHAWAESEHDLAYKPLEDLPSDQRRKVAFVAAQAWGADHILDGLVEEIGKPNERAA